METINFATRWAHVLFGIAWIGLLYYFNFIQGSYFKKASAEALADAKKHLAPDALWWFRWAAMFTFLTGLMLLMGVTKLGLINDYTVLGVLLGTLMFLNVWLVIWPNQKIALGLVDGDAPVAAGKALLASRTNTLFSAPMVCFMLAGPHLSGGYGYGWGSMAMWVCVLIIGLLEANAIVGKQGPMTSVRGVIGSSVLLTAVFVAVLKLL
ncbi:urate hydroxylase PuuD [Thalassotalea ponticola]